MYQLLATDLDGTLFSSDRSVSEGNRRAILKAVENGVHVVLCSGRAPYEGVAELGESLGLNRAGNYYICCNGALIVDAATLEIREGNYLAKEAAQQLLQNAEKIFAQMGRAALRIHTTRHIYARDSEFEGGTIFRWEGEDFLPVPENVRELEGEITKLHFRSQKDGYAMEFFDRMEETIPAGIASYRLPPILAEYTGADATKGNAVRQLAAILGLSETETVCVGDGWNDISMLSGGGLGIAVRNAPEEIACYADMVLDRTNDEDAIAAVIDRYFPQING